MKKLNSIEVNYFASILSFTSIEAQDITDLFYSLKQRNHFAFQGDCLNTVEDYIKNWENSWFRESNMEDCYKNDMEGAWGEKLSWSFEKFREMTKETIFQLPNNKMVVEYV